MKNLFIFYTVNDKVLKGKDFSQKILLFEFHCYTNKSRMKLETFQVFLKPLTFIIIFYYDD